MSSATCTPASAAHSTARLPARCGLGLGDRRQPTSLAKKRRGISALAVTCCCDRGAGDGAAERCCDCVIVAVVRVSWSLA